MSQPRRALIVIDVQNDYVGGELPIELPEIQSSLHNIGTVMDAARSAAIPVVVVQNILPSMSAMAVSYFRFGQPESNRQTRSAKTKMSGCIMSHFRLRAKPI